MTALFPRGVAKGEAFYDRVEERRKLKQHIASNVHTVLIAPRRYGKTSLMTQVLLESRTPYAWFDFMTVTDRHELHTKLLEKIGQVVVQVAPIEEKLKKLAIKYFKALNPEVVFALPGLSLNLHPSNLLSNQGITDALLSLDQLAQEIDKKIVLVFDEFQEILRIDEDATLQALIRHAAERSQKVTYFFSGSRHRPLRKMFNGKKNPLYALCEQMTLNKIAWEEYETFISQAAKAKWGRTLSQGVFNRIRHYTECYPKYVNALCSSLWNSGLEPTPELIDDLWHTYVLSIKTDLAEDIAELTLSQRRLLAWLVFNPTRSLYSQESLAELKLPQSTVQKAIAVLLDKELVIFEEDVYQVLDPTLKTYFTLF